MIQNKIYYDKCLDFFVWEERFDNGIGVCYIEKQKRKEPAGACVTGWEEDRSSTVPDLGNANGGIVIWERVSVEVIRGMRSFGMQEWNWNGLTMWGCESDRDCMWSFC